MIKNQGAACGYTLVAILIEIILRGNITRLGSRPQSSLSGRRLR